VVGRFRIAPLPAEFDSPATGMRPPGYYQGVGKRRPISAGGTCRAIEWRATANRLLVRGAPPGCVARARQKRLRKSCTADLAPIGPWKLSCWGAVDCREASFLFGFDPTACRGRWRRARDCVAGSSRPSISDAPRVCTPAWKKPLAKLGLHPRPGSHARQKARASTGAPPVWDATPSQPS